MRTLSKEAEQKLISAIEKAAGYVNSGMTPNAAIIKSAAEANVPAGHVNLMVHAYNTGRTTTQREQGENTIEKAADFQLADAQHVMDALYPKAVKTAAEIKKQSIVSAEYALSPAGMLARRRSQQEKEAAATAQLPEKTYVPYPRDEKAAAEKAYSEKRAAQLADEEKRRQVTTTHAKAAASVDQVIEYFRRPGNMSYGDALRQVELRFGHEGVAVLKTAAAVYPALEKQAATKLQHFGDNPLYGLVENVLTNIDQYLGAKDDYPAKKEAAVSNKTAPEFITGSILHEEEPLTLKSAASKPPKPKDNSVADTMSKVLTEVPQPTKTVGEILGTQGGLSGQVQNILGVNDSPADIRKNQYMNITTPDHELTLKNIRAKATLHDLMLNDSVISGHDPHDVAIAFNEIADAAPNVVESPAVLSAMLRKRLEAGQLADFDAKQLLEMDKIKAERDHTMLSGRKIEQELV